MRSLIDRRNRIDIGQQIFRRVVIVLERQFNFDVLFFAFKIHRIMQRVFSVIQKLDERFDSLGEVEFLFLRSARTHVAQVNRHAFQQKRIVAQTFAQHAVLDVRVAENTPVRHKSNAGACLARCPDNFEVGHRMAGLELSVRLFHIFKSLAINISVTINLYLEPFRQRVHYARSHAMQTARFFISVAAAEFSAGMQYSEDNRWRRNAFIFVYPCRNASSVIFDANAPVRVNRNFNCIAIPGQYLVFGVIDDLPDKMVQAAASGRADVHSRSDTYCGQAFENANIIIAISWYGW